MKQEYLPFVNIAEDLEHAGLIWQPEIGDEVSERVQRVQISILVDPNGMTPSELRETYIWLPTVEQMVVQMESRQAIIFHVGFELSSASMHYKTVIQSSAGPIQTTGGSMRIAMGIALRDLLLVDRQEIIN